MPALGRQRQVDSKFKASMIYRVSFRTARATQRNPFMQKTKQKNFVKFFYPTVENSVDLGRHGDCFPLY